MGQAPELRAATAAILAERPEATAVEVGRLLRRDGWCISNRQVRRHVAALRASPRRPPPAGARLMDLSKIGVGPEHITREVLVGLALGAYTEAQRTRQAGAMVSAVRVLAAVRGEEVAEAETGSSNVRDMLADIRELSA